MAYIGIDIPTGFTGFTIDAYPSGTSYADSEGDVKKVLFAITFVERLNAVKFTISNIAEHWSALTPTGEYIILSNPQIVQTNKDSAIVVFDMAEKYPSNSVMILCQHDTDATFSVQELATDTPFTANEITGAIGFTSNEYGGYTNDDGETERVIFNISFASRPNEVEFRITDNDNDWACLMGDGSYINLKNPDVQFQNKDGATIVFQMQSFYPSNAPAILVKRRQEAKWTITDISDDRPFNPVQTIIFPSYVPVGERVNLNSQVVVYPMNATLRGVEWRVKDKGATGATCEGGWLETTNTGNIVLTATVVNGRGIGTDYYQDINVMVIDNWIVIQEHPHLNASVITGKITEEVYVLATTEYGDLTYQWYKSNYGDNTNGTAIADATEPNFPIPKGLSPGNYYYFCEVRKTNFPSVRTNVVDVRVRDELRSIKINPSTASIPPGTTTQFAIDKNPMTSDERQVVHWSTSDPTIIAINEETGLATGYANGEVTITARIEDISDSITARGVYTPVDSINPNLNPVLETGHEYQLNPTVLPVGATYRNVIWQVINAGTTGAQILGNVLRTPNIGNLKIRATISSGQAPGVNFVREFEYTVQKAYVPVTNVTLANPTSNTKIRVGDITVLRGNISPATASAQDISWVIKNPGNTGAVLMSGNLLSCNAPGTVIVTARVQNGIAVGSNYEKDFTFEILSSFISVESIEGLPETVDYFEGNDGVELTAKVVPDNANGTRIVYEISSNDNSNLHPSFVGNTLYFDSTTMTYEDDQVSIIISITVKNGVSDGIDYHTEAAIYVNPPAEPTQFVPVQNVNWHLPSPLRAYRPIIADKAVLNPWDATHKSMVWNCERKGDIEGCAALQFIPSEDNHQNLLDNGVLFTSEYNMEFNGNYIYPMSPGKLEVTLTIDDGLSSDPEEDFVDTRVLEIKDPYIPVSDILNIPSTVYKNTTIYLSPEIDTDKGLNEQTAIWDDREASYQDVKYTIERGGTLASINDKGELKTTGNGEVTLLLTVASGRREKYTWYRDEDDPAPEDDPEKVLKEITAVDYTKRFVITVKDEPASTKTLLTLRMGSTRSVEVKKESDFNKLCAIRSAEDSITIDSTTFRRNEVTEITFSDDFNLKDLSNFGRNMTNLTKINKIPSSATNLRNFLRGCTKFNADLTIPNSVDGDRCLEGFLRDCTSFDKHISIPNVNGDKCLESFLRGCTSFNQDIKLPEEISGDNAMYYFMMGCTKFNSTITLPKKINGFRCMESALRECTAFNQPITLPEEISGTYNIAAFMFECTSFVSDVTVPKALVKSEDPEPASEEVLAFEHDVITFSTFHRESNLAQGGTKLVGDGASMFKEQVGDQGSEELLPLRTLKT